MIESNRTVSYGLRSSAAADGGRCEDELHVTDPFLPVAILGRRGRRPLPP